MFDRNQFRELIDDVLTGLGLHSPAAVNLLLGTAAQESRFGTYLRQMGKGPALGVFQMEPATERDLWDNFLRYHPELVVAITAITGATGPGDCLRWNLAYQIGMTRVHYLRKRPPIPAVDDIAGMGAYWKQHYNTPLGSGTVDEFVTNYHRYVLENKRRSI